VTAAFSFLIPHWRLRCEFVLNPLPAPPLISVSLYPQDALLRACSPLPFYCHFRFEHGKPFPLSFLRWLCTIYLRESHLSHARGIRPSLMLHVFLSFAELPWIFPQISWRSPWIFFLFWDCPVGTARAHVQQSSPENAPTLSPFSGLSRLGGLFRVRKYSRGIERLFYKRFALSFHATNFPG